MAWYVPVPPPAHLEGILACSWTAEPSGIHRLVPDACLDLLWISNGAVVLCGPETTAWDFALPAGTTAVGVRFRPGFVRAAFDLDASAWRDRRVPLDRLVGREAVRKLRDAIDGATEAHARMHVLERFVAERVHGGDRAMTGAVTNSDFVNSVLDSLASAPRASAVSLAVQLGMTTRQLHRRSLVSFGYGVSTLARLLRFQRFVSVADATPPGRRSLAVIAVAAGYSDQAHLARDCRAITGQTPTAFLHDYFPTFPDMSDPYKTRVAFLATMAG